MDETKPLKQQIAKLEKENDKLKGKELEKSLTDGDGYEGKYKNLQTGEVFALKVVEPHTVKHNKTHFAKNATHFGDYTEADFFRLFRAL